MPSAAIILVQPDLEPKKMSGKSSARRSSGNSNTFADAFGVKRCCNPFRIPRHSVSSALRNVPQLVRDRLPHVSFGQRICTTCRQRVYKMLKERKHLKPSARLNAEKHEKHSGSGRQQSRRSESTATAVPASAAIPAVRTAPEARVTPAEGQTEQVLQVVAPSDPSLPVPTTSNAPVSNTELNLAANLTTLPELTMSRRSKNQTQPFASQVASDPPKRICCFCNLSEDNEIEYGKFYEHSGIITHYYCLLLSSNMEQRGNDDEGILGFLADDIQKEIRRGKRLVCSYCKKNGATLGCCNTKCKRIFHFPCGLKAGSLHQFFGEFRSYCTTHRPKQKIDERVKKEIENMSNILCYICYEDVKPLDSIGTLWAPCCKKNAWFHRICVQQLAMSAGYFFKCPLCNNKREFQSAMLEHGIYIPRQDASWELVPNAFEELLYRHDRCDAETCLCPKGRTYSSNNVKWELILCRVCGSQGTHISCSQLKWSDPVWDCPECTSIIKNPNKNAESTDNSTSNTIEMFSQSETATLNVTIREIEEDSDSDISVGNENVPLESNLNSIPNVTPVIKLRPGPRSFKLQQVQKLQNANIAKENAHTNMPGNSKAEENSICNNDKNAAIHTASSDVICIDSDDGDEAVEIVCESVMRTRMIGRGASRKNIEEASSSRSSFTVNSYSMNSLPISTKQIDLAPAESESSLPSEENEESPFNIIISNVTSVPPEFFANVPEVSEKSTDVPEPALKVSETNSLKRSYPCDEDNECQVVEASKRARLEDVNNCSNGVESVAEVSEITREQNNQTVRNDSLEVTTLPQAKESLGRAASTTLSESSENCHGDAGTEPAMADDYQCRQDNTTIGHGATSTVSTIAKLSTIQSTLVTAVVDPEWDTLCTVLENGSSSDCSSGSGNGDSPEPRCSTGHRSGLIPDLVRLNDLKFKICGSNLQLTFGACNIELKMNSKSVAISSNDAGNKMSSGSESPFAGSNQNLSSEKSSQLFQLQSEDSSESEKISKLSRNRRLRKFVYEDDNTLLEYPSPVNNLQGNVKLLRKLIGPSDRTGSKSSGSELKENWDPEVSSSSNIALDNANNNQVRLSELKDRLNIDDNGFIHKEDSSRNQRLLRRSNRIVRHFRFVQGSDVIRNGLLNGDSADSNTNIALSTRLEKSNQISIVDQSAKSSKSLKLPTSSEAVEDDKHLKNVNVLDLEFTSGVNDSHYGDKIKDVEFRVSIDLNKIKNLISAKPDLFFKTKSKGVKRMRVYKVEEKLKVELCSGEKRLLTKAQSFDCLLDIVKNNKNSIACRGISKSFDDLSFIDSNDLIPLTDKKDCFQSKSRRSLQQKMRFFGKPECVR